MEGFWTALEAMPPIEALRFSRWSYAAVNTAHVIGISLLVGGSLPLSLRLIGFWAEITRAGVTRILATTAGIGLGLALVSGALLFATRAGEYATHPLFPVKIALVAVAALSAIHCHWRYGWELEKAPKAVIRRTAVISLTCWFVVLVMGRLIAFVDA